MLMSHPGDADECLRTGRKPLAYNISQKQEKRPAGCLSSGTIGLARISACCVASGILSRTLYPDGTWNNAALGSVRTIFSSLATWRSPLEVRVSVITITFNSGEVQVSTVETNGLSPGPFGGVVWIVRIPTTCRPLISFVPSGSVLAVLADEAVTLAGPAGGCHRQTEDCCPESERAPYPAPGD